MLKWVGVNIMHDPIQVYSIILFSDPKTQALYSYNYNNIATPFMSTEGLCNVCRRSVELVRYSY